VPVQTAKVVPVVAEQGAMPAQAVVVLESMDLAPTEPAALLEDGTTPQRVLLAQQVDQLQGALEAQAQMDMAEEPTAGELVLQQVHMLVAEL
jgi:hypothetical protein